VDPALRVDLVNRVNFAFDYWNIAEMNDAFSENVIVDHPRGRIEGRAASAKFLDADKPLTMGIRRMDLSCFRKNKA
jgi:hypothetical protein